MNGAVFSATPRPSRAARTWLVGVVLGGLLLRLGYVVLYPQQPVIRDAEAYDQIAERLLTTGVYSSYDRAPLYPVLLALVYSAAGHQYTVVRVTQAIIVSMTALIVFFIGRALFDERRALLGATAVSAYPAFFGYAGLLLTETLFAVLLTVVATGLVGMFATRQYRWPVFTGVAIGLATLCRSEALGLPGLVFVGLFLACGSWRESLGKMAVLVLALALTITPWVVRNVRHPGQAAPVAAGLGATLWLSSYPGDWLEWHADREPLKTLLAGNLSPQEQDQKLARAAIGNIMAHPVTYLAMCAKRLGRFWIGSHSGTFVGLEEGFGSAVRRRALTVLVGKAALLVVNLGLLAAAVAGAWLERRRWKIWLPLSVIIVYCNVVHVFLFSTARYQIPIMPLVLLLSATAFGGIGRTTESPEIVR